MGLIVSGAFAAQSAVGRALARNGAVTLINDTISAAHCTTGGGGSGGGTWLVRHIGPGVPITIT
jgi:hypothetical protein